MYLLNLQVIVCLWICSWLILYPFSTVQLKACYTFICCFPNCLKVKIIPCITYLSFVVKSFYNPGTCWIVIVCMMYTCSFYFAFCSLLMHQVLDMSSVKVGLSSESKDSVSAKTPQGILINHAFCSFCSTLDL